MPDSFRPEAFEARFIESTEPRLLLEGERNRRKRELLLRAAFHRVEDPGRRVLVLAATEGDRAELVRESHSLKDADLPGQYMAHFRHWRFVSNAVVRFASSLDEASRGSDPYDRICIDHVEEFPFAVLEQVFRLLRVGPGRAPSIRATHRVTRKIYALFPERVTFETGGVSFEVLTRRASPETEALEAVVLALTTHLHATRGGETWRDVVRARENVPHEHHEQELHDLTRMIDTCEADRDRLIAALERARHRLAEMEGAEPGACHRTCDPIKCSLRQREAS